jgi:hypothetical protein
MRFSRRRRFSCWGDWYRTRIPQRNKCYYSRDFTSTSDIGAEMIAKLKMIDFQDKETIK